MSRGRTAKPTALRLLQGNAGHRKLDGRVEPSPTPGAPLPPEWLSDYGKDKWHEIVAVMMPVAGWLTKMDGDLLTNYCSSYGQFREAEMELPKLTKLRAKTRSTKKQGQLLNEINQLKGQRRQAMKDLKSFGTELGWSPTSRTRIRLNGGQGELNLGDGPSPTPEAESPFEKTERLRA